MKEMQKTNPLTSSVIPLPSYLFRHTSSVISLPSHLTPLTYNPSPYLVVSLHVSRLVKGFVAQQFLLYYNKKEAAQTLHIIGR